MAQPTTRILAVLELLQNYGRLSGAEISAKLGLERRTVRRYIMALEELGIPIMTERGRYGGYTLMPGFKLQPLMFDESEAMALAVGLLATKQTGLIPTACASASAQAKLERVMPHALKHKVRALSDSAHLALPTGHDNWEVKNEVLLTLSMAVSQQQRVIIQYVAANQHSSTRDVAVYGVAYYLGAWYMAGFCYLRQEIRTFRIDRISEINSVNISFERPADFDVLSHLQHTIATLPREFTVKVLLQTTLDTALLYIDPTIGVLAQVDEGIMLNHQCSDLPWFARQLAFWPFDFVVHQPSELLLELKKVSERLNKGCEQRRNLAQK
ncbi:transcriptional regulator [Pseudoalteromonas citrea]|uniref:Transcriptional regulator n=1 Tax=Pseudoalteromonas citrea TaxID=43655 RepID=A0A5S3XGF9_9GAMM|nr:YafY family protein [Pseudoalteromonas citrea]TMP40986.1 transcriptional regulator [Pseudoalteromonas citrea]TMP51898.1 transcriptional regulator [Pseudoalteromonas citrea]